MTTKNEVWKRIEKRAEEVLQDDPTLGNADAVSKALELDPALYSDYLKAESDPVEKPPVVEVHKAGSLKAILYGDLEKEAEVLRQSDPKLTDAQAFRKAMAGKPRLYEAYIQASK